MNLKKRVDRLFSRKSGDRFAKDMVAVMKYFGWSHRQLVEMPVPSYFAMVEMVNKLEKESKKK